MRKYQKAIEEDLDAVKEYCQAPAAGASVTPR